MPGSAKMTLVDEAIKKFGEVVGQTRCEFEMHCRRYLDDNNASKEDYSELNDIFSGADH